MHLRITNDASAVVPDLDALVRAYVCPVFAHCAGLSVGTTQHQHTILGAYADLSNNFDIESGQGYVLRALLADDPWTALRLAEAFDAYNSALHRIRDMLLDLPDLPPTPTA